MEPQLRARHFGRCWKHRTRPPCLPSDDLPDKSDQTTRTDFCKCCDSVLPRKLCYYCFAFSLRWAIIGVSKESFTLKIFDFKIMKTYTTGFFFPKNFQSDTGSLPSGLQFSMRVLSAPRPCAHGVIFLRWYFGAD